MTRLAESMRRGGAAFAARLDGPLEPAGRAFVLIALTLIAIGVVAVYSASTATGTVFEGDPAFHLKRQVLWVLLGLTAMAVTMRLDPRLLQRAAGPLLVTALVLLALVLVPALAPEIKGARRWLHVPGVGVSVQPSEVTKMALVLWLATHLSRNASRRMDWLRGTVPAVVPLGLAAFLVLIEPDFGTALFLGAVGLATMLVGGVPMRRLLLIGVYALPAVAWQVDRRWGVFCKRFAAVGAGDAGRTSTGGAASYQIEQAMIALGSGGLFGQGLGAGHQKLFFLPEARTDFILPILGEELGFAGTALVVALFAALVLCGLRIALGAARRDRFGFLLVFGLVFWIGLQAAGNVAVVTASVPTKGIALPFLSFGGSSMLVLCVAVGLVYSVTRHADAVATAHRAPTWPSDAALRVRPQAFGGAG